MWFNYNEAAKVTLISCVAAICLKSDKKSFMQINNLETLYLTSSWCSDRFRQLEVLQQVTTTFSSLVGATSQNADTTTASQMSAEARERRKRMAMILRRASKKSLSQAQTSQNQNTLPSMTSSGTSGPESTGTPKADKKIPSKRTRMSDNSYLFPLEEEQGVNSEAEPVLNSSTARGTSDLLKLDFVPPSTEGSLQRPVESFELEEVKSAVISSVHTFTLFPF